MSIVEVTIGSLTKPTKGTKTLMALPSSKTGRPIDEGKLIEGKRKFQF